MTLYNSLTCCLFCVPTEKPLSWNFFKSICCGLYPVLTNPPKTLVISINVARADLDLHLGWIMEFDPRHPRDMWSSEYCYRAITFPELDGGYSK